MDLGLQLREWLAAARLRRRPGSGETLVEFHQVFLPKRRRRPPVSTVPLFPKRRRRLGALTRAMGVAGWSGMFPATYRAASFRNAEAVSDVDFAIVMGTP